MDSRRDNGLPEVFTLILLRDACRRFISDHRISRLGDIWDASADRNDVMDFIEEVCDIIGYCNQEE